MKFIIVLGLAMAYATALPVAYHTEEAIYAVTDHYVFAFELSLRSFHQHCTGMGPHITADTSSLVQDCNVANKRMHDRQCEAIEHWALSYFMPRLDGGRYKRQLAFIATALASVGISAILQGASMHHVNSRLEKQGHALERLKGEMIRMNADFSRFEGQTVKELVCVSRRFALLESQEIISGVTHALETLTGGHRVTTDLLPPAELRRLWPRVLADIKNKTGGAAEFDFPVHAVYEMPATYVYNSETLEVYVHMPLVREKLTLYRRDHFPLKMDAEGAPMYPAGARPYLATNREGTAYLVMGGDELAGCQRIQGARFCTVSALYRTYGATCEGALFEGRSTTIKNRCQLEPFRDTWAVTRLASRDYTVYMGSAEEVIITCTDGNRRVTHLGQGFTNVSVPEGCVLAADNFVLPQAREFDSALHVINRVDWQFEEHAWKVEPALPGEARRGVESEKGETNITSSDSARLWVLMGLMCTLGNIMVFGLMIWRMRGKMREMQVLATSLQVANKSEEK